MSALCAVCHIQHALALGCAVHMASGASTVHALPIVHGLNMLLHMFHGIQGTGCMNPACMPHAVHRARAAAWAPWASSSLQAMFDSPAVHET